jgi:SlyX protein
MKGGMMNEDCGKRQLDDQLITPFTHHSDDHLSDRLVSRIDELEIRVAFLDDLLDSLNATVAQQAQQLMDLHSQFKVLCSRVESGGKDEGIEAFDAASEVPPHY